MLVKEGDKWEMLPEEDEGDVLGFSGCFRTAQALCEPRETAASR